MSACLPPVNGDLRGFTAEGTGDRAEGGRGRGGSVGLWLPLLIRVRAELERRPRCARSSGFWQVGSSPGGGLAARDERGPWPQAVAGAGRAPGSLLVEDAENRAPSLSGSSP